MEKTMPYINYAMIPKYIGNVVRLICKVDQISSEGIMQVETSDKGIAIVHMKAMAPPTTLFISVTGTVKPDLTIEALSCDNFGNSLDMNNLENLIKLMSKTSDIFY